MKRIMFLHGLEGSPEGPKVQALRPMFPQLEVPDLRDKSLEDRLYQVSQELILGGDPAFLVGSSLGGLMATILFDRFPELVSGYLLLAPAMQRITLDEIAQAPTNAHMILGTLDSRILNDSARQFARRFNIPVTELEDEHRLSQSNGEILYWTLEGYNKVRI